MAPGHAGLEPVELLAMGRVPAFVPAHRVVLVVLFLLVVIERLGAEATPAHGLSRGSCQPIKTSVEF